MAAMIIELILGSFLLGQQQGAEDSVASRIATGLLWAVLLAQVARR
ncbi:MAG: hypothetical protein LH650_13820 [Chloroflexi bacterium]|nr:hypothetical protein [Chloroflexota bacterium]